MSDRSRTGIPNSLQEHWMPFTSNKSFKKDPRLITEAKGVYIKDHKGRTQIDASSGLFCNPLGHGRKEIINAITRQLETLDFVTPFQQGFGGSFDFISVCEGTFEQMAAAKMVAASSGSVDNIIILESADLNKIAGTAKKMSSGFKAPGK